MLTHLGATIMGLCCGLRRLSMNNQPLWVPVAPELPLTLASFCPGLVPPLLVRQHLVHFFCKHSYIPLPCPLGHPRLRTVTGQDDLRERGLNWVSSPAKLCSDSGCHSPVCVQDTFLTVALYSSGGLGASPIYIGMLTVTEGDSVWRSSLP